MSNLNIITLSIICKNKTNANSLLQRDRRFEKLMKKRGFVIKPMGQDGACLFRSVADQVYGDQEMHAVVRNHCMDYIVKNFRCSTILQTGNFMHII